MLFQWLSSSLSSLLLVYLGLDIFSHISQRLIEMGPKTGPKSSVTVTMSEKSSLCGFLKNQAACCPMISLSTKAWQNILYHIQTYSIFWRIPLIHILKWIPFYKPLKIPIFVLFLDLVRVYLKSFKLPHFNPAYPLQRVNFQFKLVIS